MATHLENCDRWFLSSIDRENLFDHVVTDLILVGIVEALKINGYLERN